MVKGINEIIAIMNIIRKKGKKVITNYYCSYNNTNAVFNVVEGKETIVFCIQEKDVYRIFFYSCNKHELGKLLKCLPAGSILDVIAKKDQVDKLLFKEAGFYLYNTYARFGHSLLGYEEQKNLMAENPLDAFYESSFGEYALETDLKEIQILIEKGFDKKTDHLFTDEELLKLIRDKNVIIEREKGRIFFVYIYRIEGKKFYCNLIYNEGTADVSYSIEKKTILNAIKEYGVNYAYSWIALTNKRALRRNGLPEDGIYNYIFEKERSMFLDLEKKKPDTICAIEDNGTTLTYGELLLFAERLAKLIPRRSLVFSFCKNTIGSLAGYVAFLSSEIVPLLLNEKLDAELRRYLLDTYQPDYIWMPEVMLSTFGEGELVTIVARQYGYILAEYSTESKELYPELALLLTTSGSTGSPKLVRQSYHNIESNAASIAQYLELDDSERPITMLPMNYTYGLSVINSHLYAGATILMTDVSYAQRGFWDFFKKENATSLVGVPYTYELLKKLRFFRMELPSLRYMTQAGGKLLPELHKEFAEYARDNGKRFYVMYGQTEATARMSYLPYNKSLEKYGSMGVAIPGGKFYLVDADEGVINSPHVTGELVYEGPNVTLGYAENLSDLAKGDERQGRLITGDMAQFDEDGYYYIVGRKKRFLKIYGNRVNLDECERMIESRFEGVECACVGEDDHMKIYVTDASVLAAALHYLSEKTGLHPKAFEAVYIPEIPKNDSGKKQYVFFEKLSEI